MSGTADDTEARTTGPENAGDPVALAETIAERVGIVTLDAAAEAARSVEHGARAAREAAQLKALAAIALDAVEDIEAQIAQT